MDTYLPARDGKAVAERWSTILMRTPYSKSNAGAKADGEYFAGHGYAVVIQDTGAISDGVWHMLTDGGRDGFDTCAWIAKQRWSNGTVGTIGTSYVGGVLAVTTVGIFAAGISAGGGADPDESKVKGTWVIVASEQGGSKDDDLKGCTLTFAGGMLETDSHGEKGRGKHILDSRAKPKTIDLTFNVAGPIASVGVYSLTEDTLTIRLALGVDRPVKVEGSTEKDGSWLLVLKREPKKSAWSRLIREMEDAAAEAFLAAGDAVEELLAGKDRYWVGQIIVTGSGRIPERVIRVQIPLYPGQPLRFWRTYMAEFRLARLGCFVVNLSNNIRPRVKADIPTDSEIRFLDIHVDVVEKAVHKKAGQ
jgi:uncharacterized protein (TIGR03067 family)